ncbi:MAG TPA: hypothetical protein VLX59_20080, partial [Acidimicrobiales bacterium]|nr:hypothetical protein [Acidimicrobiales bacterium]
MSIQDWSSLGEVGKGPRVRIPLSFGDRTSGDRYGLRRASEWCQSRTGCEARRRRRPPPRRRRRNHRPGATGFGHTGGQPLGIAAPEDGPEWLTSKNMFPVYGYLDTTKV